MADDTQDAVADLNARHAIGEEARFVAGGIASYEDETGKRDRGSWRIRDGEQVCLTWNTIAGGREQFSVELDGRTWTQAPQKYHAKSLAALRQKYAAVAHEAALEAVLERSGCLEPLRA